jgi:hypothetical protein
VISKLGAVGSALAISALASVVNADSFTPMTLEECQWSSSTHHSYDVEQRDLGGGYISFQPTWSFENSESSELFVMDCRSGKGFSIGRYSRNSAIAPSSGDGYFDHAEQVDGLLTEMLDSPQGYTIDTMAERFEAEVGKEPDMMVLKKETCACQVLYPGLQGTKVPFDPDNFGVVLVDPEPPREHGD